MNAFVAAALWVVLTSVGLLVSAFPRRFELFLGPWLGRFFFLVDAKRRGIARENMRRCLPEMTPAARERLLRENFDHYGILGLEILHMFSPIKGHFRRYVERNAVVDNIEEYRKAHALGRGVILVTGHFANWEMMGVAGLRGVKALVTGRRLKPEWLNARVVAARKSLGGSNTASGSRILAELLRWIKQGNASAFILDQYAAPPAGLPVKFFGITVDTQSSVSLVVQRTGAPVLMLFQRRDEDGVIHDVFEPVDFTDAELADPAAFTQKLAGRVEAWIRAHPSQWLWMHRRFKNVVWPSAQPA